jgi:two-component system LytT family sensor kinase
MRRGLVEKIFNPFLVLVVLLVAEVMQMSIILIVAKPFEQALDLVETIALPMIIANSLGAALFMSIIQDRKTIYEKYSASFSSKALTIAERTVGVLSTGFNEENTQQVAEIIYQETGVGAVSITDRSKILAFIGIGADHHLPGTPISSKHTKQAIENGELIFADGYEVAYQCSLKKNCHLGAALIIPLLGSESQVLGTIKLYEPKQKLFSSLNHSLGEGLAKLLSNQILNSRYLEQQTLLTQAELRLLQAQVNPHFLFNALNTISAVIRQDPDKARELVQHLSQFFRRNLKHNIESISIQDELKHIQAYLEIELARFSDRLTVNIDIDESLLTQFVPTFTLQPIVENAIKHGTSTQLENGVIDVNGYLENGIVVLKVVDNAGTYCLNDKEAETGIGVQIVDKRLKNSFGEQFGLTMSCESGEFTCAEIRFPFINEDKKAC